MLIGVVQSGIGRSSVELNTLAYLDVTFRLTCTLMHVYRWYYIFKKKKKASAKATNTDTRTTDRLSVCIKFSF